MCQALGGSLGCQREPTQTQPAWSLGLAQESDVSDTIILRNVQVSGGLLGRTSSWCFGSGRWKEGSPEDVLGG